MVTISGGADYAGKPRPALVVQSDVFDTPGSLAICPFTTHPQTVAYVRLPVEPTAGNGLKARSWVMIDKIQGLPRTKIGGQVGQLTDEQMGEVGEALALFLGIVRRQPA